MLDMLTDLYGWMSAYGKTIQSDDRKSPTFFFLCAFELWNCHSIMQLIQGGHTIHNILHIFESLNCPSCHVSRSSGQLFCKYPLDRKLWHKVAWSWVAETATQHLQTEKPYLHFHFYVHFPTSCCHHFTPTTLSDMRLHEDNWQTTEKQRKKRRN